MFDSPPEKEVYTGLHIFIGEKQALIVPGTLTELRDTTNEALQTSMRGNRRTMVGSSAAYRQGYDSINWNN